MTKERAGRRLAVLARFLHSGGMEEKLKAMALEEFGTLEGVEIDWSYNQTTRLLTYCFRRMP